MASGGAHRGCERFFNEHVPIRAQERETDVAMGLGGAGDGGEINRVDKGLQALYGRNIELLGEGARAFNVWVVNCCELDPWVGGVFA